jgi:hypothetical protein
MPQVPPPSNKPPQSSQQQSQQRPAPQAQQQPPKSSPQPQGAPPAQQPKAAAPPPKPQQHDADKAKHDDKGKDDKDKAKDEANARADENKKAAPQSTRQHDAARDNPAPANIPPAGVAPPEYDLPTGARPHDKRDPQSAKFEAHAAPPFWNAPRAEPEAEAREEWTPDPALDAREQAPPRGYYADGMSGPDEQRARAAWVEQHGLKAYDEATDQRAPEDRPVFDPNALTGGAFVRGKQQRGRQVPGVTPPTKRD